MYGTNFVDFTVFAVVCDKHEKWKVGNRQKLPHKENWELLI